MLKSCRSVCSNFERFCFAQCPIIRSNSLTPRLHALKVSCFLRATVSVQSGRYPVKQQADLRNNRYILKQLQLMDLREQSDKSNQLLNRMNENQNEVDSIRQTIEREIIQIQQETAGMNIQRAELQQQIQLLKRDIQINQREKLEQGEPFGQLKTQIFQYKKAHDLNKKQILQLKARIKEKREKYQEYFDIIKANGEVAEQFDRNVEIYTKLQEIHNLLNSKSKLQSQLYNVCNQAKSLQKK